MGASLIAEGLLDSYLPNAPWRPLVSKFGYSIGFLVVILGRQQLFTEKRSRRFCHCYRIRRWQDFGEWCACGRLCSRRTWWVAWQ